MTELSNPIFHDADKAREHLEALRWPNGPFCPFCGQFNTVKVLGGKSMGAGWYHCMDCRRKFTVRVGTVYERSKIPLHKWIMATHLMTSSKKGISAHQLHRMLGVTYKTAWFMAHRIREGMIDEAPFNAGNTGGVVEVDETFIGRDKSKPKGRGGHHKYKILTLVDRTTGKARSIVIDDLTMKTIMPILRENIEAKATIYTDEAGQYQQLAADFAGHDFVRHSTGEYVRGDVHTNTLEGFFSIFKRGMKGIYQHCGRQHLHRYTSEFDFRYSNRKITDWERTAIALKGAEGKRLTYRRANARASA